MTLNLATKLKVVTLIGSNPVHVTSRPDYVLAVYRQIPVQFQLTGNDLFQTLTFASFAYILTHIRKFIGLIHFIVKVMQPLCSPLNGK
jgi:hypothetical protein